MSSVHLIEYIKSENTEIYQPRLGADIITLAIDSLKKSKNALKSIFCDQVWIKHYNFAHKEVINDSWIQIWLVSHEFRKPLEANFSVLYVSSSRHVFTNFSNTKLQIFSPIFHSWKIKQISNWPRVIFSLSFKKNHNKYLMEKNSWKVKTCNKLNLG